MHTNKISHNLNELSTTDKYGIEARVRAIETFFPFFWIRTCDLITII